MPQNNDTNPDEPVQTNQAGTAKDLPKTAPGFLKDADGNPSSMRLMSIIALFASIWFGWMTLQNNSTNQYDVFITTAFIIAAFAPKALQKFIENYYPKNK